VRFHKLGTAILVRLKRRLARIFPKLFLRRHPIDGREGIETSAMVIAKNLKTGDALLDAENIGYVGSAASVVRRVLATIPELEASDFIDMGSGKGRALIIASEFPFRRVVGVELSTPMHQVAEKNVAAMAARHPSRPRIELHNVNALTFDLGQFQRAVVFLFNPFKGVLFDQFAARLEAAVEGGLKAFVVYYNPVHHQRLDRSTRFERYSAELYHFAPEEMSSAPTGNQFDSVIVYQSKNGTMAPPLFGAGRLVRITIPDYGADVQNDSVSR
jgi:SAM-dependent methyltransferase